MRASAVPERLARDVVRVLDELAATRSLAPASLAAYRRTLLAFAAFLPRRGRHDWAQVDAEDVRAFVATRQREGRGARTLARELSSVRRLLRHLAGEGRRAAPLLGVRAPRQPRPLPEVLDADLVGRLLDFPPADPDAVLDRALLELLYSSALRVSELVAVDCADLDLKEGLVRVTGKGQRTRILPVGRKACEAVALWYPVRAARAAPDEPALFVGVRGRRLGRRAVAARLARRARLQGLDARVYPHLLRHSCATHLLESSGDLRGVQEFLGHRHLTTTQIYTHLDFQHLARIYDGCHPRARRRP
jgi:integrase/recombinase XerC